MKMYCCTILFVSMIVLSLPLMTLAQPEQSLSSTTRCQICGMFVAKYPNWISVITLDDATSRYFDGVKDLMVFILNSGSYGVAPERVQDIWVKDYYSLEWIDGRQCFYVIGSDVYGPMGHEFIPFSTEKAALNFQKDHHGTEILTFASITIQRVESLRVGQKMR
jgi:copper chaperone NosL